LKVINHLVQCRIDLLEYHGTSVLATPSDLSP
jgi:hypothetical protein